eukprot:5338168-Prymnesium_polylepis.2
MTWVRVGTCSLPELHDTCVFLSIAVSEPRVRGQRAVSGLRAAPHHGQYRFRARPMSGPCTSVVLDCSSVLVCARLWLVRARPFAYLGTRTCSVRPLSRRTSLAKTVSRSCARARTETQHTDTGHRLAPLSPPRSRGRRPAPAPRPAHRGGGLAKRAGA